MNRVQKESGEVDKWLIVSILAILTLVGVSVIAFLNYRQYSELKTTFDSQVELETEKAKKVQLDADEKNFSEREKNPNRQFVAPSDLGRLTFSYPKTWSVYVNSETGKVGQTYYAYLHPSVVPPVGSEKSRFAVRVSIATVNYDEAIKEYSDKINDGLLTVSTLQVNGVTATRMDGMIRDQVRGSVVVFKVRDKVVQLYTDADTFKPDFDKILSTVSFDR